MARIRSIKPEFWTAEQVMECSPMARLLFIGMWNFCDDGGNHPASAKTLKAEVFPSDDITACEVQALIDELLNQDLLIEYQAGGKNYLHVTGWARHQRIEKPNFRHPDPNSQNNPPPVADQSPTDPPPVADQSPPEWSGVGIGVGIGEGEGEKRSALLAGDPPTVTRKGDLCRRLRHEANVADAAPHQLDDATWALILGKRTDEEIVEFAKAKVEARQGQRTGLRYLAPGLIDDPKPILPNARASPTLADRNRQAADEAKRLIFGEG